MVAKSKSILKQIHWSLLAKAAIFAVSWFFLPFWLFLLIALYLYFVPFSQARKLFAPFFVLLILAYIQSSSILFLLVFGAIFYYLLLIKDLLLIDRRSAYELTILSLCLLLFRAFYESSGALMGSAGLWYAFLVAALVGLMVSGFIGRFAGEEDDMAKRGRRIAVMLSFLLIWQFLVLGLFLPLNFIYQSVIIFLVSTLIVDFVPAYCLDGVSRQKTQITSTAVFALFVIVLASASWQIR